MKRWVGATNAILTSVLVVGTLLCVSFAEAAIVTVTVQGVVGSNGVDQVALGANGAAGVFGPPGALAGKPFTLVYTIDDSGGVPDGYYSSLPESSGTTNMHNATAVLTVGGVSVGFGTLPGNTMTAGRSALTHQISFSLTGGPVTTGNTIATETLATYLGIAGNLPFTDNNWRSPFSYTIPAADLQSPVSGFGYSRAGFVGTTYTSISAGGTLIASTITVSSDGAPPPGNTITPQVGLWWNPAEDGSGYALDYKHGVLVVTVYSYTAGGAPQWYIASGPVTNNTFSAPLLKVKDGQCISCAYKAPTLDGNDGTVTITFTSATTATMTLPGGRTIQIVPQAF